MTLAVDNPIVNSPVEQPAQWWDYSEGQHALRQGRRPAGYYLRPRTRSATGSLFEEEFIALDVVNEIRQRVKAWREHGYPGATRVTQEILAYWNRPDRERTLFFCQREAAETIIWLVEAPATEHMGLGGWRGATAPGCSAALQRGICGFGWPMFRLVSETWALRFLLTRQSSIDEVDGKDRIYLFLKRFANR